MTLSDQRRIDFANSFNAILGNKTGRPMSTQGPIPVDQKIVDKVARELGLKAPKKAATKKSEDNPILARQKAAKKSGVTPSVATDPAAILGLTGTKPTQPKINLKDIPKVNAPKSSGIDSLGALIDAGKHGFHNVAAYLGLAPEDNRSAAQIEADKGGAYVSDITHAIDENRITKDLADWVIKRPMDFTQRLGYAANEMGMRAAQNPTDLGNILHGGASGLAGTQKTSFRENIDAAIPDYLMHPIFKTAAAFLVDTAENPATWFKGGAVNVGRGTTAAELSAGEAAVGLDAYKAEYGAAVEEGLNNLADDTARSALDKSRVTKITPGRISGTKAVESVVEPTLTKPEFGKYYHGSSSPIPEFTQYTGKSADNLYGPGVYTTDTGSIAGKYTAKGAGIEPSVYRLEWANPERSPNMLNLEKPSPAMHQVISQETENLLQSEWFDSSIEAINDVQAKLTDPTTKAKDLYQSFRTMLADGRMHTAEADDIMQSVNSKLNENGYDALAHVGGAVTKGQKHGVTIWLNPQDVRIAENVTEHAVPRTVSSEVPVRTGGSVTRSSIKDRVIQNAQDSLDKMIFEEKSGRVTGGGSRDVHGTLSSSASEDFRNQMIDDLKPARDKFVKAQMEGKVHTSAEFAKIRKSSPLMSKWLDTAQEVAVEAKKSGQDLSAEDIGRIADTRFPEKLDPIINELRSNIKGNLQNRVSRVGKISMGKHDVYLPKVSRMITDLNLGRAVPENFRRAYLMSSWLPGATTLVLNRLRSMSKMELKAFTEELQTTFNGTTLAERRLIKSATEAEIELTGKMGEIQKKQVEMYKQMFDDEVTNGVRSAKDTPYAADYTFNRIKGGQHKLQDANLTDNWINPRKRSIKDLERKEGVASTRGYTGADAKKLGLKVEEDAANALMQRKIRSINKLSKTNLNRDLVAHYGIKSRIAIPDGIGQDLVKIDPKSMPKPLLDELKPGEHVYLHKDIQKVIKDYDALMAYNQTKEARNAVKALENLTQIYKVANTMYWPGFHMRNMLSDFFMGQLDGVKASTYPEIFKMLLSRKDPMINIGGETFPFSKLQDSYLKNASSGYFDAEAGIKTHPEQMMTTRLQDSTRLMPEMPEQLKAVGNKAKQIHSKVAEISQAREDLGRLVHYRHAMDEEYAFNRAKGYSKDKAWANAEAASQLRVNRFKFDYDALTPWEKKLRRYGMPFYTYMRKATPVLLENMIMNPRYFFIIKKLQEQMAPSEEWQNTKEPSWMRDQNLSMLTDTSQPWGFTDALNPYRTVSETYQTLTPFVRDNRTKFASSLNPIGQLPFELASGKDVFSGKPVNSIQDWLMNKWKGTTQISSALGPKSTLEKALYAAGLPVYQVTDRLQATKAAELKSTMQNRQKAYNKQLAAYGLRLEISNGQIELVQPKSSTGRRKVVGTFSSFDELGL